VKYLYNPVSQELDKIADIEAAVDKKEADKLARESGWRSDAELTNYIANQPSAAESKGAWKKFVEQRQKEDKIDEEIINFGKDFQPHKNKINSKRDPDEWTMHITALHSGEESSKYKKHLIEDVQLQPNRELRGMLTEKIYNAKEAITMNEKYDRNFTNPNLSGNKQTYLTANEKVLANFNPTEALKYTDGGKDKENVQYMRYVKSKAKRIAASSKSKNEISPTLFQDILKNLGKSKPKNTKTAMLSDEQKKDPKIIDLEPHLPSFEDVIKKYEEEKKKENADETYKIRLPRDPIERRFAAMVLQRDLEKDKETNSGIAQFIPRVNYAGGANGSTSSYDKKPTYQKQIEDLYEIQLTGQETIAELLEIVRELNEKN